MGIFRVIVTIKEKMYENILAQHPKKDYRIRLALELNFFKSSSAT